MECTVRDLNKDCIDFLDGMKRRGLAYDASYGGRFMSHDGMNVERETELSYKLNEACRIVSSEQFLKTVRMVEISVNYKLMGSN